ncbi:MAG: cytochrome c3 family protein [Gemmatimonadales bacterium]|nr:cytochrome c3 family protein [Gemmatimonadales bacterium]
MGVAVGLVAALCGCGREEGGARRLAHQRVACLGCHREGAVEAGRVGVPDGACSTQRCHPTGGPARARVAMVEFAHDSHPAGDGRVVPCAACHSHAPDSMSLAADASACVLCHFTQIAGRSDTGCAGCHPAPRHTRQTSQGLQLPHPSLQSAQVPCTRCHYQLVEGDTAVAVARCTDCHRGDRARPAETIDTTINAARAHTTHGDFACRACHTQPAHRVVAMSSSIVLRCLDCHASRHRRPIPADTSRTAACADCHESVHSEQQRLMLGLMPGEELRPNSMFMAGVTCRSCHAAPGQAPPRPGRSLRTTPAACTGCHGGEWSGILQRWRRGYARRRDWVSGYLRDAEAALGDSAAPRAAKVRLRQAGSQLAFVDRAGPMHNLPVVDQVMRRALALTVEAYQLASRTPPPRPELGPPVADGGCTYCHYGIEEARAGGDTVSGRPLTHAGHVLEAGLSCDNCHAAGRAPPGIPDSLWIDTTRTDRGPRRRVS